MKNFQSLLNFYNLSYRLIRKDINLNGSPERTLDRFAFEDENGRIFIAEKISHKDFEKKEQIAKLILVLSQIYDMKVTPYLKNSEGDFITKFKHASYAFGYWQIMPYIDGIALERSSYLEDEWRGKVFAKFLQSLHSIDISIVNKLGFRHVFSLKDYVLVIAADVKRYHPYIYHRLVKTLSFLEKSFFANELQLKVSFSHGDFHPLNIIWGEKDMTSVIDWEFCGLKPEIYDLANLVGCIGIENPEYLTGVLMEILLKEIYSAKIYSDHSFETLLDYIIALRFAWLSEWLRKNDEEMIDLELTYMNLLVDNYKNIKRIWNI